MRLADPWWLLLILPVLGLAVLLWWRARKPTGLYFPETAGIEKIVSPPLLGPDEIIGLLTVAGLLFVVVAMARPQFGLKSEQISGKGVDIILCLDTSGSMRSVDFKPQNRLGAAKEVAQKFIAKRMRDRIGLVVFGGISLTVCPLTPDKRALQEFMRQVKIDMTGVDGTAVGMALATAADRLRESKAASRVILLLTDGRNNQGAIDPVTAA
ncbi:VWA domain-containing protein, partial [candidate division FCPU426 bacterium]|nr:VWA domain-containing protein [candidate division FCPU426 bacterium]